MEGGFNSVLGQSILQTKKEKRCYILGKIEMAYWIYKLYFGNDGAGGNSWKEKTLFLEI